MDRPKRKYTLAQLIFGYTTVGIFCGTVLIIWAGLMVKFLEWAF